MTAGWDSSRSDELVHRPKSRKANCLAKPRKVPKKVLH